MPTNLHVLKENSLNIPRGLYLDSMGNQLSDANANTLLAENAAMVTLIQNSSVKSISNALTSQTYMAVGDSKTIQGVAGGPTSFLVYSRGYWGRAINLAGVPLRLLSVAAVGGYTASEALNLFVSHLAKFGNPGLVFSYFGVNDFYKTTASQTSTDSYKATMLSFYKKCSEISAKIIRVSIPPKRSTAGAFYTASLIAKVKALNSWDEKICQSYGWGFVDPWRGDIHGQPTNVSGYAIAANYYDNLVHESNIGAYILGKAVAAEIVRITGVIGPTNTLANSYIDSVVTSKFTLTSITGNGTTATATLAGHPYSAGIIKCICSSGRNGHHAVVSADILSSIQA